MLFPGLDCSTDLSISERSEYFAVLVGAHIVSTAFAPAPCEGIESRHGRRQMQIDLLLLFSLDPLLVGLRDIWATRPRLRLTASSRGARRAGHGERLLARLAIKCSNTATLVNPGWPDSEERVVGIRDLLWPRLTSNQCLRATATTFTLQMGNLMRNMRRRTGRLCYKIYVK